MQRSWVLYAVIWAVAMGVLSHAQAPIPLKPLAAIRLEVPGGPDLDGPRLSIGFSQPTPIRDVLMILVRDTRLSVVPDPSLNQRFVGDLKNVTIREALDLILEPLGLDYAVRGQVIRVFPRELETRFFSIDHVITQRTGARSIGGSTGVNSTDAPDVFADLAEGVRALLSHEGRMSVDRTAALLQVTDRPNRLARVEQYVETAMLRVMRQVQIEAKVVQIELREGSPNGIEWRAVARALPRNDTATTPPNGFTMSIAAGSVGALLDALAAQGTVTVISSPILIAMNNEPATMRVSAQSPDAAAEGVALSVTPQISTEGVIHMSVSARMSDDSLVREADHVVRVRQGDTAVISGLSLRRAGRTTDMVILLTPTILQTRAVS